VYIKSHQNIVASLLASVGLACKITFLLHCKFWSPANTVVIPRLYVQTHAEAI